MSVLFPHLPFDAAETPISYATRLASFHLGRRLVPFLNDMGIKPMELVTGELDAIQRLSSVTGVQLADLTPNTPVRTGNRRYNLRGNLITAEFLSSPHTHFCPACLMEDDHEQVGRRGRFTWTLRTVRTCPTHGLPVMRRPKKCWDDQFRELDLRVPERDQALEDLARCIPARAPSPLQEYVLARLDGQDGPTWLDGETLEQAVRATEMLGVLIEFGAQPDLNVLTEDQWDRAGAVGFEFTSRGEVGIREALLQAQSAFTGSGKPGNRKVFGRLYEWLSHDQPAEPPGDIKRILRQHIFDTAEVAPGENVLGEALDRRRFHSIASLAKECRLDARTLRNVLVAKGLIPVSAKVEGYHVFDAEAGEAAAASVKRAVHVVSMPDVLHCTRPQFDQLVQERVLTPLSGGRNIALGRTQKAIDAIDVANFICALHAPARSVAMVSGRHVPIAKAAEKAKLPCIDIVHLILGEFLDDVVRLEGLEGYSAIMVDPEDVKVKMATLVPGVSASQTSDALSIPMSAVWELVDRGDEPRLKPLIVLGENGYRFHRFDPAEIAAFRTEFVSKIGLAAALGVLRTDLVRKLNQARVKPVLSQLDIAVEIYRIKDLPAPLRPPSVG